MMEKLREALELLDGRDYLVPWDIEERLAEEDEHGAWLAVTEAARRVLDAPERWWCPAEQSTYEMEPLEPWGAHECAPELGCGYVRMVPARLITEEMNGWETCGTCGGIGVMMNRARIVGDCPDCVDGLVPPDGMIEAAMSYITEARRVEVMRALVEVARTEKE